MNEKYKAIFEYKKESSRISFDDFCGLLKDDLLSDENSDFYPLKPENVQQAISDRVATDESLLFLCGLLSVELPRSAGITIKNMIFEYWSNEIDKMIERFN